MDCRRGYAQITLIYLHVPEFTGYTPLVEENATANLWNARARGNSSYDPTTAITVYYNQVSTSLSRPN